VVPIIAGDDGGRAEVGSPREGDLPDEQLESHQGQPDMWADLLVVGAGPAGAATAAWAARAGMDVLLVDSASFPRDKTCGDGLTPRAVAELHRLGLGEWLQAQPVSWGLRAHGFGQTLHLPWPGGSLPDYGSAVPRYELDAALRTAALTAGARSLSRARAVDLVRANGHEAVDGVVLATADGPRSVRCRSLVVADGARSQLSRRLGRQWHKETVYGVAARAYVPSEMAGDPWISSHLELRGSEGELLSGYGWIFPLGGTRAERPVGELWHGAAGGKSGVRTGAPNGGLVNIGVGTLATAARPARTNLGELLAHYVELRRDDFGLHGEHRARTSALLPMGGAVSGIAGGNWMLVGDAAGGVNPLNGEGIDYALEMGRLAVDVLLSGEDPSTAWPTLLSQRYGAPFSIARRLAGLLTVPGLLRTFGPVGMSSRSLMAIALRLMGNLMTAEDEDTVARLWRRAGRWSSAHDDVPLFLGPAS
jgi:flavin-dependent dehydrogenase